jgi:hypothetical protein
MEEWKGEFLARAGQSGEQLKRIEQELRSANAKLMSCETKLDIDQNSHFEDSSLNDATVPAFSYQQAILTKLGKRKLEPMSPLHSKKTP